jgi:hypothetical protein
MLKTIAVLYKIENSGTVAWRAVTTAPQLMTKHLA